MRSSGSSYYDDIVKATEDRLIEKFWVVCGSDDQARAMVVLDELEKGIQHATNFADVIWPRPLRSDRIEFVEEIHAPLRRDGIEYQSQAGSCLSHEFADEAIIQLCKKWQLKLMRQRRRGHCLARAWWAD